MRTVGSRTHPREGVDQRDHEQNIVDCATKVRTRACVFVIEPPFSYLFRAEGFCDVRQPSWQAGYAHGFECFGGVPGMLAPVNAPTATNHSASRSVTVPDEGYKQFDGGARLRA